MEFEILGPVRVRATDPKVAVTARMLKTLLGLLLVRANTAVPADAVFEVLWEGQPVDAATRAVASCAPTPGSAPAAARARGRTRRRGSSMDCWPRRHRHRTLVVPRRHRRWGV